MGTEQKQRSVITPARSAATCSSSAAALRWRLLRRSLLTSTKGSAPDEDLSKVSRRPAGGYNLVPWRVISPPGSGATQKDATVADGQIPQDMVVEYSLSAHIRMKLMVWKHCDGYMQLHDLAGCQKNSIDNTGISCLWPAEEVLTYFCGRHPEIFRNKTVIELGSGYGLAGLAIGACTEAAEVVITDGNLRVVDYIKRNITANSSAFGNTRVSCSPLYWTRDQIPLSGQTFDLVVAADCTFFKDFHTDLAYTIKSLLGTSKESRAILLNPQRGNTLDLFVHAAEGLGLHVEITEQYDARIWNTHQQLLKGDQTGWPNYDGNHCYPLLLSLTSCGGGLGGVPVHESTTYALREILQM